MCVCVCLCTFERGRGSLYASPEEMRVRNRARVRWWQSANMFMWVHVCIRQRGSCYMRIMGWMGSSYKYGDVAAAVQQPHIVSHQSQSEAWQGHSSAWLPQNEEISQRTSYSSYIWTVFVRCVHIFLTGSPSTYWAALQTFNREWNSKQTRLCCYCNAALSWNHSVPPKQTHFFDISGCRLRNILIKTHKLTASGKLQPL